MTGANSPLKNVKLQIFDKQQTNFEKETLHTVNLITDFFDFFGSNPGKSDLSGDGKHIKYLDELLKTNKNFMKSSSDWMKAFVRAIGNGIHGDLSEMRFIIMESVVQAAHGKLPRLDKQNQPNLEARKSNARYVHSNLETLIDFFVDSDGMFKKHPLISAPLLINVALIIAVFTPIGNQLIPNEVNELQLACKARDVLQDYLRRAIFLRADKLNSMDLYYKHMAPVLTQPYSPLGYNAKSSPGISHCSPGCTDKANQFCLIDAFGEEQQNLNIGNGIMFECVSEYTGLVRYRTEKMFPVELLDKLCGNRKPHTKTGMLRLALF